IPMILTITPNPTLDRAVFVQHFQLGAIVRGEREVLTPSGKGVDVSLVLHALGHPTLASGLQAGRQGRLAVDLLTERGVPHDFVWADGETRHATVLIDAASGTQSTISTATLRATREHLDNLLEVVEAHIGQASYAVLAGSLPTGWPATAYLELVSACRAGGVPTLLDTSGAALAATLNASDGTIPDVVKINSRELLDVLDRVVSSPPDSALLDPQAQLRSTAALLREQLGNAAVVVTMGAQGAIAATEDGQWHCQAPHQRVVNDAGAGDALAAGLALARSHGQGWDAALRLGTALAAAVVTTPGTAECDPLLAEALYQQVTIEAWPRETLP
ncbi:MAG TPA: 1-phosphofructokinase family hexose kinase, partial [Roseiflexaceae bacterium]|nr:1-phosphofructokinase family hexose kinase [Roseiflexaceae bacterium]